jgi:hypothetical protein
MVLAGLSLWATPRKDSCLPFPSEVSIKLIFREDAATVR